MKTPELDPRTLLYVAQLMKRHGHDVRRFAGRNASDVWALVLRAEANAQLQRPQRRRRRLELFKGLS
jgi:hypothetical protein